MQFESWFSPWLFSSLFQSSLYQSLVFVVYPLCLLFVQNRSFLGQQYVYRFYSTRLLLNSRGYSRFQSSYTQFHIPICCYQQLQMQKSYNWEGRRYNSLARPLSTPPRCLENSSCSVKSDKCNKNYCVDLPAREIQVSLTCTEKQNNVV